MDLLGTIYILSKRQPEVTNLASLYTILKTINQISPTIINRKWFHFSFRSKMSKKLLRWPRWDEQDIVRWAWQIKMSEKSLASKINAISKMSRIRKLSNVKMRSKISKLCEMKKLSTMYKIIEWVRQLRRVENVWQISQFKKSISFQLLNWLFGVYYFLIRIKRRFVKNLTFLSNIDSLPSYHEIVMQEFDQEISFGINAKMCLFVPLHLYILVVLKCFLLICYKVWNVRKRLFFKTENTYYSSLTK
jgi:hypothetical protein